MLEEEGAAVEAGKMTIVLKKHQQHKGFMERSYQLSSKIPSSHHNVSYHAVMYKEIMNNVNFVFHV